MMPDEHRQCGKSIFRYCCSASASPHLERDSTLHTMCLEYAVQEDALATALIGYPMPMSSANHDWPRIGSPIVDSAPSIATI